LYQAEAVALALAASAAPGAPRALCVLRGQAAWPGPAGAVLVASQSVTCESIGYTAEAYHLAGINTC
jgi:hypothetical protein